MKQSIDVLFFLGIGKSTLVTYCAWLRRAPLLRFLMSANLTVEDFLGRLELQCPKDETPYFKLTLGPFAYGYLTGCVVFLDEFNLGVLTANECKRTKNKEVGACVG